MIDLYTGTPGSGKSLHVAQVIRWALRLGEPVIANFDFAWERCTKKQNLFVRKYNWEIDPEFLIDFSREFFDGRRPKEDKIILVIDECQLIFNAREWNQKGRAEWLSFFTQHRKYGYHVILICQFDGMLDKQIRSLVEYEHIHRKLSNFGWKGWILSLIFGGKTFVDVKVWYPMNQQVDHTFFHARKGLYTLYDTFVRLDEPSEDQKKSIAAPARSP